MKIMIYYLARWRVSQPISAEQMLERLTLKWPYLKNQILVIEDQDAKVDRVEMIDMTPTPYPYPPNVITTTLPAPGIYTYTTVTTPATGAAGAATGGFTTPYGIAVANNLLGTSTI